MTEDQNVPFDWQDFHEGRARFAGQVRGADQLGHEVFAIDIEGEIVYGEMRKRWVDHRSFQLEVMSLGHRVKENIGIDLQGDNPLVMEFTAQRLRSAEKLVRSLVESFAGKDTQPTVLFRGLKGSFSGEIVFRNGWVVLGGEGGAA